MAIETKTITAGVNVIGLPFQCNDNVTDVVDANIEAIYTLINGQWQSWTKGTPDEYQGFLQFQSGMGYSIKSTSDTTLSFNNNGELSFYDVPKQVGLNFITFPNCGGMQISDNFINIQLQSAYTVINGNWQSWISGVPDEYQGFLTIDENLAYSCKIQSITPVCSVSDYDTTLNDEQQINGVLFDTSDSNPVGTLHFNSKTYNDAIAPTTGFFSLVNDSNPFKIQYATEYEGDEFLIQTTDGRLFKSTFQDTGTYTNPIIIPEPCRLNI